MRRFVAAHLWRRFFGVKKTWRLLTRLVINLRLGGEGGGYVYMHLGPDLPRCEIFNIYGRIEAVAVYRHHGEWQGLWKHVGGCFVVKNLTPSLTYSPTVFLRHYVYTYTSLNFVFKWRRCKSTSGSPSNNSFYLSCSFRWTKSQRRKLKTSNRISVFLDVAIGQIGNTAALHFIYLLCSLSSALFAQFYPSLGHYRKFHFNIHTYMPSLTDMFIFSDQPLLSFLQTYIISFD